MNGIKMFCQHCGWGYVQTTAANLVTTCPKCFSSWFGSEPPTKQPLPQKRTIRMSPISRTERLLAVACAFCKAKPGAYCVNVRNGIYARAGKTVTSFHWQRIDEAKQRIAAKDSKEG